MICGTTTPHSVTLYFDAIRASQTSELKGDRRKRRGSQERRSSQHCLTSSQRFQGWLIVSSGDVESSLLDRFT